MYSPRNHLFKVNTRNYLFKVNTRNYLFKVNTRNIRKKGELWFISHNNDTRKTCCLYFFLHCFLIWIFKCLLGMVLPYWRNLCDAFINKNIICMDLCSEILFNKKLYHVDPQSTDLSNKSIDWFLYDNEFLGEGITE